MFSFNTIYSSKNALKEVDVDSSNSTEKKLSRLQWFSILVIIISITFRGILPEETSLDSFSSWTQMKLSTFQWLSILAAIVLIALRRILPENMRAGLVADLFGTTMKALASVSKAKAVTEVVSRPFEEHGEVWDEPLSAHEMFGENNNDNATKTIWGYWNTYPDGLPFLCEKALESWRLRNPGWRIIMINDTNFKKYVSVSDLPSTFYSLKVQHQSDIIRLAVLIRYGGVYLDASSLVYKGFDGIWEEIKDDQLLLTSLNHLPEANVDFYNNGLLMSKTTQNPFLLEWRKRILDYCEAPALTVEDMRKHKAFQRVHQHWDSPALGVLGDMIPYHSNLWILNDMIWHNDLGLSKHILHLPKIRWGFYYHALPYFFDKLKIMQPHELENPHNDPKFVSWGAFSLLLCIVKYMTLIFHDNVEIANGVIDNIHILKFTSHDMPLIDVGVKKVGLDSTIGRIFRAAYDSAEYPTIQSSLRGAVGPALAQSVS